MMGKYLHGKVVVHVGLRQRLQHRLVLPLPKARHRHRDGGEACPQRGQVGTEDTPAVVVKRRVAPLVSRGDQCADPLPGHVRRPHVSHRGRDAHVPGRDHEAAVRPPETSGCIG
eukprot:305503-Prorocentrum_minimum.AAC.6